MSTDEALFMATTTNSIVTESQDQVYCSNRVIHRPLECVLPMYRRDYLQCRSQSQAVACIPERNCLAYILVCCEIYISL